LPYDTLCWSCLLLCRHAPGSYLGRASHLGVHIVSSHWFSQAHGRWPACLLFMNGYLRFQTSEKPGVANDYGARKAEFFDSLRAKLMSCATADLSDEWRGEVRHGFECVKVRCCCVDFVASYDAACIFGWERNE